MATVQWWGCRMARLVKDFKKIQEISNILNVGSNMVHAREDTTCVSQTQTEAVC